MTRVILRRLLVAMCFFVGMGSARAAHLTEGLGQALIFPYYTARGGYDTLLSIVNNGPEGSYGGSAYSDARRAKAVKVRFFEGRNGRKVVDFNLYLAAGATWTAGVTRDEAGDPVVRTWDNACTIPSFAPTVASTAKDLKLSSSEYSGFDRAGSGLDRAMEGHIEVLEMGEVKPDYVLAGGKLFNDALQPVTASGDASPLQDCAAIAAAWAPTGQFGTSNGTELTAPTGLLSGHGILINVAEGTEYSYDPTVIDGVYSAKHHTAPNDVHPDLSDADPVSQVMINGVFRQSTWINGVDAISAVLMHSSLDNEYVTSESTEPGRALATDVVITFPTKSYYVARESDTGQGSREPFVVAFDDLDSSQASRQDGTSSGACESVTIGRLARNGLTNADSFMFRDPAFLCWQSNVISFGDVLSSANATPIFHHVYAPSGSIRAALDRSQSHRITSVEGHIYHGLPVVGFAVQRRVNGNVGGVLSNYGGVSGHKYFSKID
jgi:hypothetical protein